MSARELIHDWGDGGGVRVKRPVIVRDETFREGNQSCLTKIPRGQEEELLNKMEELEIAAVDIGLVGSKVSFEMARRLAGASRQLSVGTCVACRMVESEIDLAATLQNIRRKPVEVLAFLGCSDIHCKVKGLSIESMVEIVGRVIDCAVKKGLPVAFVAEDATRATPEKLGALITVAISQGVKSILLCDTCGVATPASVRAICTWTRRFIKKNRLNEDVTIGWHGHNDRGMALANALEAIQHVHCVDATWGGIGERSGNTPMELLLANLAVKGLYKQSNLPLIKRVLEIVAESTGRTVPDDYPVFGRFANTTQAGVHGHAISVAAAATDRELADNVYSGFPPSLIGEKPTILVGPLSGKSNVEFVCQKLHIQATSNVVRAILEFAQSAEFAQTKRNYLSKEEILKIADSAG